MSDQLAFAFATGMLATVNPCGFAMLPGFFAYYVGSGDGRPPTRALMAGVRAGAALSAGFASVFVTAGLLLAIGLRSVIASIPWVAVAAGVLLVAAGLAQLLGAPLVSGRLPVVGSATQALARGPGLRGVVGYGAAYAVGALSCSLALLLALVAQAAATDGSLALVRVFGAYALGSSIVLMLLAVCASLARHALARWIRLLMPYASRAAGGALSLTGIYLLAYWMPALVGGVPGGPLGHWGATASAAISSVVAQHSFVLTTLVGAVLMATLISITMRALTRSRAPGASTDTSTDTDAASGRPRLHRSLTSRRTSNREPLP